MYEEEIMKVVKEVTEGNYNKMTVLGEMYAPLLMEIAECVPEETKDSTALATVLLSFRNLTKSFDGATLDDYEELLKRDLKTESLKTAEQIKSYKENYTLDELQELLNSSPDDDILQAAISESVSQSKKAENKPLKKGKSFIKALFGGISDLLAEDTDNPEDEHVSRDMFIKFKPIFEEEK